MKPRIPDGAKVEILHYRRWSSTPRLYTRGEAMERGLKEPPLAKGGMTLAFVVTSGGSLACGRAACSKLDNYDKAKGRMIATGRALKSLESLKRLEA